MKTLNYPLARRTASEFNATHQWDCNAALALALEALHDCNWHSLARELAKLAQAEIEMQEEGEE